MAKPSIQVESVGKRYRVGTYGGAYVTLREALSSRLRRAGEATRETWALRDVSFDVGVGEAVGVIGANGAGKSTLLKILARIARPTTGVSRTRGRVGSLLEVGTGFHPELTGRENVYLNAAVLGLRRQEIARRFDEIVDFSGVERFLDTPLKRYSSGMHLRLAFAVAAHVEPEILVVDEVLAVGDARFRDKCLGKMTALGREERTVLFVSHDLGAVARLCPRSIWLEEGRIRADGETAAVVDSYLAESVTRITERRFEPDPARTAQLVSASAAPAGGRAGDTIPRDEPFVLTARLVIREPHPGLSVAFVLHNEAGVTVLDEDWGADTGEQLVIDRPPQEVEARLTVPPVLPAGEYRLEVWAGTEFGGILREEALSFRLTPRPDDSGESLRRRRAVQPAVSWAVEEVADVRTGSRSGLATP
jgi:ABC-type polysaccharide/polyol phosphate transport system ATPase subunit